MALGGISRFGTTVLMLALFACTCAIACGDDGDAPPPLKDFKGTGGRRTVPQASGGKRSTSTGGASSTDRDAEAPRDAGSDASDAGDSGSGGAGGNEDGGKPSDVPTFSGAIHLTRGKNALVTGVAAGPAGTTAFVGGYDDDGTQATHKAIVGMLASDGKLAWELTPAPKSDGVLDLVAVARGPGGTVFVAGTLTDARGDGDAYVAEYDAAGKPVWDQVFGSTDGEAVYGLAVDGSGLPYVSGTSEGIMPMESGTNHNNMAVRANFRP